ncbi:CAV2 protein, partial [Polyodon spathula]|nr:CAV2 protein [Polyodon spathula]
MGKEKEKSETRIIMDDDEFNKSIEPILPKKKIAADPDRDPKDINSHLKVNFEDVIAEPDTTHSFDKVWICSNAVFELAKFLLYRLLTTILAIPLSFVAGILFAVLSSIHIWYACFILFELSSLASLLKPVFHCVNLLAVVLSLLM